MLRMKTIALLLTFALALNAAAQELNCDVTVNTEKIPSAQRDYLRDFESVVENYLNNTKWTDEDMGGEKIDCMMSIFFIASVGENAYTAQIVVGSQRPVYVNNEKSGRHTQILRIVDEKWEFGYVPNQPMIKDDFRFDPLTDVLDFYAYLIIGMDLDTYTELSGTRYLQRALNICNQASATSFGKDWQSGAGTYSRFGYLDELMNLKNQQFRLSFFSYHFDGIDLLGTEKLAGLDRMMRAIESIAEIRQRQNPRSTIVKTFFDSKYLEIAEVFLAWPDRLVYDRLNAADPGHQGTYDDYRRR